MTDKIGVLGEATTATVATTTVYTVPSGKAAKVKLMYIFQADAGGTTTFSIAVNGITVASKGATTASHYMWSSSVALLPTSSAALPTGLSTTNTCAPGPETYYLSAGDTVTYTIGTATALTMNMQVVGTEIDV